jgi:hypothetical protein
MVSIGEQKLISEMVFGGVLQNASEPLFRDWHVIDQVAMFVDFISFAGMPPLARSSHPAT